MALNVGINVQEVDGRAVPAIPAAATSVAAFVGVTDRGVPNRPVRVTSLAQFRDRFGGFVSTGYVGYAIEGFFLNGGREAYVARVTGAGSVPASVILTNTTAAGPSLRVAAGYRSVEEPGKWGERLRVDVRDDPRASTAVSVTVVLATAQTPTLASLSGIRVGSVLRFVNGAVTEYHKVQSLDPAAGTVTLDTPLANAALFVATTTIVKSAEFGITVRYQPTTAEPFGQVEEWANLSMEVGSADYAIDRVNHPFTGSRYIALADLSGAAAMGVQNPKVASNQALGASVENAPTAAEFVGTSALRSGLFSFDLANVQLLAVPDVHRFAAAADRVTVVRGALDYCAGRGDCMFVGGAPDRGAPVGVTARAPKDYTQLESDYVTTIKSYSAIFQGAKVYGALYAPWIQVSDPIAGGAAPTRFVPPEGHIMGVYARTELERGIFKAPAGNAALVRGALDVSATFADGDHTDLVRNGFVNGVRFMPGLGIVVAASRTLSTDTRWWFVGTRLLFNFVKSSLRDGLRFVRQEPHTSALRRSVNFNVVRPFLLGLWRQGAFGSDPPDMVFTIKCDAENNPPTEVDLGNFGIEVYFYPVKPAETILIVVGQQPNGASAAEA
jgi:phage tail sheath protein FI